MKSFHKLIFLGVFLIFSTNLLFGQTYEDFKKSEQQKFNRFKSEQRQQIAKLRQEYNAYVEQSDKMFSRYLKENWKEFNAFKGMALPLSPKPVKIPHYEQGKEISQLPVREIPVLIPAAKPRIIHPKPILPIIQKTEPNHFLKTYVSIDFYGKQLNFQTDENISRLTISHIDEQSIGNWWTECSSTNYNLLVNQLLNTKNKLSLNDWAYFMLVRKTADRIDGSWNDTRLLTWFLMIRSGYNIKIAYAGNQLYLLIPSADKLYGKSYLTINNEYYFFTDSIGSKTFQTYDFNFPGATRTIDLNITRPLNIGTDVVKKQIIFTYKEKKYSFPIVLDVNNLFFMRNYPITNLGVFFNAAMSQVTKQSLTEGLMPYLDKMNNDEALNFLLSFVQHAFKYETDQQQFGREKFFFPEEVFFYKASDCEDRAALFSYLVKQLLHLQVIGLEYKGHVATAVHLNKDVPGDYLYYHHEKYVMADPTYINAPLGLTMPQYKNSKAKIVETDNTGYLANLTDEYWHLTKQKGGFRGSNLTDARFDSHGNCYLTGYYSKVAQLGSQNWHTSRGKREAFIVKYNKNKQVIWARNLQADSMATAFALTLDSVGNPVIAGSFSGKLSAEGHTVRTKKNADDVFVAAFNTNGDLLWLQKSGLDTISHNKYLNYVVHISPKGQLLNTKLYFENNVATSNGIFYNDHSYSVVGQINNTTGFEVENLKFNSENNFDVISFLKKENDALIDKDVNKSIAGLFAVIDLIKLGGMVISGKEAQQALNKYNPHFRTSSPKIYQNIGKVIFLKNNSGIINILTDNKKSVSFNKIKINNGATIKIASLQNGNEQIDIMSGIVVGKLFVWYNLNFVRLMRNTGNMLFDYDSDHTRKILNIKNDLLY